MNALRGAGGPQGAAGNARGTGGGRGQRRLRPRPAREAYGALAAYGDAHKLLFK